MGKPSDNSSIDMSYNSSSTADIISHTDTSSSEVSALDGCSCFHNIKIFAVVVGILSLVNGAIAASYLPAVLTTIEQKFELGSSTSGLIVSSYEIGAVVAVIVISYFGHYGHIPRILAIGSLIIGVGTIMFCIPHWISPAYTDQVVLGQGHVNFSIASCSMEISSEDSQRCSDKDKFSGSTLYISIFIIAQIIIGIGSSPIMTIAISYIDNAVKRKVSGEYIGIIYAASILGAVIGYGGGSAMINVYIDVFTHNPKDYGLTSKDTLWLGAWWGGFLVFTILMCLISPWLCLFPKSLKQANTDAEKKPNVSFTLGDSRSSMNAEDEEQEEERNVSADFAFGKVSELPKAMLELIKNPVYMLVNFGSVFVMLIVTGFTTFAPKYLETQFYVDKSNASLITGGAAIPPAVIGVVLFGYLMKRFNMSLMAIIKSVALLNVVALVLTAAGLFIGCDDLKVAGINHISGNTLSRNASNWVQNCDENCNCRPTVYKPVCVNEEITYPSRCHLGCSNSDTHGLGELCSCSISGDSSLDNISTVHQSVAENSCKNNCRLLPAFLVVLALVSFALAASKTPIAIITLRCVRDELKSFGLGIQIVVIRLLALLPAPIIYGAVIDSSCDWRKEDCGQLLNCLVYDNTKFRYTFLGLSVGFHVLASVTFTICWIIMRKDPKLNTEEKKTPVKNNEGNEVYITHL